MPTPLILDGILAKAESSYGTDPTPAAADDGVRIAERVQSSLTFEWDQPNTREEHASGSLIALAPNVPRGRIATLDIAVELRGAGAAYSSSTPVRPEIDPLLIACALARTHDDTGSAESVSYALADTGHGSCTIWAYSGGVVYKIVGCRGSMTWPINAGEQAMVRFQMTGLLSTTPATASLPSITYDSALPPTAVGVGLTVNPGSSWSPDFPSAELALGITPSRLRDANSSDGIEGFFIGQRIEPRFSLTAREVALSSYNPWSEASTAGDHDIDLTLGSTQYNRVKLDENDAYLTGDPELVDDEGFAGWQLEYALRDTTLLFD